MKCNKKQEQSPVCAGKQEHGAVTKTNKKSKNNKNRKKKFFQKSKRKTNTKANLKKKRLCILYTTTDIHQTPI
jgi:hypothetical protein